ncbi:hypothetical protein, partial [Plasmodium yoelii yoelii]
TSLSSNHILTIHSLLYIFYFFS